MRENIGPILRAAADTSTTVIPAERYPWMVLIALIALIAAVAVGARAGRTS